jgi:hypothetical protein
LCFISSWHDPDTFETESHFFYRGRASRHVITDRRRERLIAETYAKFGIDPDVGDDPGIELIADEEVADVLLDLAESHWDTHVMGQYR